MSYVARMFLALFLLALPFRTVMAQDPCSDGTEIESSEDEDGDGGAKRAGLDFPGGKLELDLTKLAELERQDDLDDQLRAWWAGSIGRSEVRVEVRVYLRKKYAMSEPEQVARFLEQWYADPEAGDPGFRFATWEVIKGKFGSAPFGCLATGTSAKVGEILALGGVYPKLAYSVTIDAKPRLEADARKGMLAFLRAVRSACKPRDPKWTRAEVHARWGGKPKKIFRTKHYVVMTNSAAGRLYARKMEECYSKINKIFPIHEIKGRRLMPVFLFKDKKQYGKYGEKAARMSAKEVAGTKGHAYRDYYATYYDTAVDPVHIHEATHQIFTNRLFLDGGGSWFQEAVAEYMCTSKSERRICARNRARLPLAVMIREEQLSGKHYGLAATLIEYLREATDRKKKFPVFIQTMGRLQNPTVERVDAAFKSIYGKGTDVARVGWADYWKRNR